MIRPPPGYRFDPFADARMGVSLFQMRPEDWLVRDSGSGSESEDAGTAAEAVGPQSGGTEGDASPNPLSSKANNHGQ